MSFAWRRRSSPARVILYRTNSAQSVDRAKELLPEGKTYDLGRNWGARTDPPHHTKMQQHTHITRYGQDVWVVNVDGTDSHGTDRGDVPNWVMDKLRKKQIIERVVLKLRALQERRKLLLEADAASKRLLTFKQLMERIRRRP